MALTGSLFSDFLTGLDPDIDLPGNISLINPYPDPEVKKVVRKFCSGYYHDNHQRCLVLGINPGRFGAGITGIPFTDPVELESTCGITNSFQKKQELSSRFIYEMIQTFGGAEKFYKSFLISAVCPLGFLQANKNCNYYDSAQLLKSSGHFIKKSLLEHSRWNISPDTVICLGKRNAACLEVFNRELKLFRNIITLEHPRYIMQYKLRLKRDYIGKYWKLFKKLA